MSLCGKNLFVCPCKSPVICTCYFRKGQGCHFILAALLHIYAFHIHISWLYLRLAIHQHFFFYPRWINNKDINCFLCQQNAAADKSKAAHLFICLGNIKIEVGVKTSVGVTTDMMLYKALKEICFYFFYIYYLSQLNEVCPFMLQGLGSDYPAPQGLKITITTTAWYLNKSYCMHVYTT